jgi:hypothetical protein
MVGRILFDDERAARVADEGAMRMDGEVLRSAFAISDRHVLTAWHCARDAPEGGPVWFRLVVDGTPRYVPMRRVEHTTRSAGCVVEISVSTVTRPSA